MKNFKQLSKRLLESISPYDTRLNVLVRAGLIDEHQLSYFRDVLALNEDVEEKKIILEFVNNVINILLNTPKLLENLNTDSKEQNGENHIFTKDELYKHFDINGDGVVDMQDYASHIAFHQARPELLAQHMAKLDDVRKHHSLGNYVPDCIYDKYGKDCSLVMTSKPEMNEDKISHEHTKPIDPPTILVLRRKLIRNINNNQRVAVYYSDALNKYVTVPYTGGEWAGKNQREYALIGIKNVMEALQSIEEDQEKQFFLENGSSIFLNYTDATKIIDLYNTLDEQNQQKMIRMMISDEKQFTKLIDFAYDNV